MKATLLILAAIGAQACQRERVFNHHPHRHVKRQGIFPPALTPDEEILMNSFDATSISEWSYYYSMLHEAPKEADANVLQLMVPIWQEPTNLWLNGPPTSGQNMALHQDLTSTVSECSRAQSVHVLD
jgi:hypothetical protein